MSNPDSFIEEVTEEVRRERLFKMFRRYGWIGITAVILIVAGAAWNEWNKAQKAAKAQALGDSIIAASNTGDVDALQAIAAEGQAAALTKFLASTISLGEEDTAGAGAALQSIADDTALPDVFRDLAVIKRVLIETESLSPSQRRDLLMPLSQPGAPYRAIALEQLALIEIEEGQTAQAIESLNVLLNLEETTEGLRQRAAQLIVALGGTPLVTAN